MGYTYYNPLKVWLDPASIADVVSYMQTYLEENPIKDTEEINQIIADYITAHPEIIGGVQSVNGETGAVVLTASDINTTGQTTIQEVLTSLSSQISEIAQTVTQNTDDITDLKSAVDAIDDVINLPDVLTRYAFGRLDRTSDINIPTTATGRAVFNVFTIDEESIITVPSVALSGDFGVVIQEQSIFAMTFDVYKQVADTVSKVGSIGANGLTLDDTTAVYRVEFRCPAYGTSSSVPTFAEIVENTTVQNNLYLTISNGQPTLADQVHELTVDVANIGEDVDEINDRIYDIETIRQAIGVPEKLETNINFFDTTTDIRNDVTPVNNGRGETGVFRLYTTSKVTFSQPNYQFRIFKQTTSNNVNTIEDVSGKWVNELNEIIIVDNCNAIYRIMIRRSDSGSMRNEDFSALYFTLEKVDAESGFATDYPEQENKFVKAVRNARTDNRIVAVLSADNHYNDADWKDYKQTKFAKAIADIAKKVNADFIINLGDIIEGYNDSLAPADYDYKYVNYQRLHSMVDAFASANIPLIYATGHHEMYPIGDTFSGEYPNEIKIENRGYPMADVYRLAFGEINGTNQKGFRRDIVCVDDDPTNSLSYYFDFTRGAGTIRFIVVDGCDFSNRGYSAETITFVTNALNDAKTNSYPVVMMSHIPPISQRVITATAEAAKNEAEFNAAVNGVGANIIAYFYGHVHHDNIIGKTNADWTYDGETLAGHPTYPIIGFDCQKLYRQWRTTPALYGNPTCPARTIGTYTEYAFDVVIIDTGTKRIDCYRFGAGDTGTYPTRSITQ